MENILAGTVSALWLGLLTSISPCPLASNVAAVSFLSKKVTHPFLVFISGASYTLGRMLAYAVLGWFIISSFLSVPHLARFLQEHMGKVLGPLLVVTGLILLEVITIGFPGFLLSPKHQDRLAGSGIAGSFLLGFIFSLAFCPVSAALFFGSLIPLAVSSKGGILLPFFYGIGTGVPVLLFSVIIALGITSISRWFHKITRIEYYMRKATGIVFILVGLYYVMPYIIRLF